MFHSNNILFIEYRLHDARSLVSRRVLQMVTLGRAFDPKPLAVFGHAPFGDAPLEIPVVVLVLQDLELLLVGLVHEPLVDAEVPLPGVAQDQFHVVVDGVTDVAQSVVEPFFVAVDEAFVDDRLAVGQVIWVGHQLFLLLEVLEVFVGALVELFERGNGQFFEVILRCEFSGLADHI